MAVMAVALALAIAAAGCGRGAAVRSEVSPGGRLVTGSGEGAAGERVRKVALLPLREEPAPGETAEPGSCPVCGVVALAGPVEPGAAAGLEGALAEAIREARPGWAVVTVEPAEAEPGKAPPEIAAAYQVEATIEGIVRRYRERVGSAIGVERPASVSVDVHLHAAPTGRLLCWGTWSETQEPLAANVLDLGTWLGRGGEWVTARALAREGIVRILESCPVP